MEALIVSKTKMKNAVCVGALLLDYDANIRLLNPGNRNQPEDTDFEIGQIWNLRFIKRNPIHNPHTEDRIVLEKTHVKDVESISDFLQSRKINLTVGNPNNLFEKKLEWHSNGSGFILEKNELPDFSVCFWKADKDLLLYSSYGKSRYRYDENISFPYVGLVPPIQTIKKGTLIRMSLTRAFDKDKTGEKSSWLQLSGWYDLGEHSDEEDNLPF